MKTFKSIFLFVAILIFSNVQSQSLNINKIQGIWIGNISTDPNSTTQFYEVIKDSTKISIMLEKGKVIEIRKSIIGFLDIKMGNINIADLKKEGKFLCDCIPSKEKKKINCSIIEGYDIDGDSYWFGKTDIYEFNKLENLPNDVILKIINYGSYLDKIEFLKYLLNKNIYRISQIRAFIYNKKGIKEKMYLVKGDEVEILEEKEDWLKIRYYGKKIVEGWIKKSDVE